jgi:N-acetylneuraminic acid mutarotase
LTNTWSLGPSIPSGTLYHAAVRLHDGKVLFAGGVTGLDITDPASTHSYLYDPVANTLTECAPAQPHSSAVGVLLDNYKVLLVGGASAEIYDPVANSWSSAGTLTTPRYFPSVTLLPNGKVLVVAGENPDSQGVIRYLDDAEIYDPATNAWSAVPAPSHARGPNTAVLLPTTGKVLVTGGYDSSDLFDPATNSWSPTGKQTETREGQIAALLPSGKVLLAGGGPSMNVPAFPGSTTYVTAPGTAEIYDPATNTWSVAPSMLQPNPDTQVTVTLPSGAVLAIGGSDGLFGGWNEVYW